MDYIPLDFYGVEPPTSPLSGRFKISPKKLSCKLMFDHILGPMAHNSLVAFGDLGGIWRSIWGSLLYLLGSQRKREWEVLPRDPKFLGFKLGIWVASSGLSTHISEGNPAGRVSH